MMAKRKQDSIKNFRGEKRAMRKDRQDTDEWMAGTAGTITRGSQKQAPPFQVTAVTKKKSPPLTKEDTKRSAKKKKTLVPPVEKDMVIVSSPPKPSSPAPPPPVTQVESEEEEEEDKDTFDQVNDSEGEEDDILEEQLQVVTAKGKTPRGVVEEAVLTVVQYQAAIADYKDRLVRAERQVRAISKTNLADKFMESEVRKYVKESLWKRCKFITCAETMEDCMAEVACEFNIPLDKRDHWKSTYAHAVRDALNNRRNNTSQDLKKELTGT
jgi:hypothetical protein